MCVTSEVKNDVTVSHCRCGKADPMVGMYFVAKADNGGYARGFVVERSHEDYWLLQFYKTDGSLGSLRLVAVRELDGAKFYLSQQSMACVRLSCV